MLIIQAVKVEKVIGIPKNEDQRAVILPQRTMDLLTWWHDKTLFPDDEHYIFHGEWGEKYLYPDTITVNFKKGLTKAKFNKGGRNLTVHSLRHTYNTRMERVLPAEILRYIVGHRTPEITAKYVHVTPEERLEELTEKAKNVEKVWR